VPFSINLNLGNLLGLLTSFGEPLSPRADPFNTDANFNSNANRARSNTRDFELAISSEPPFIQTNLGRVFGGLDDDIDDGALFEDFNAHVLPAFNARSRPATTNNPGAIKVAEPFGEPAGAKPAVGNVDALPNRPAPEPVPTFDAAAAVPEVRGGFRGTCAAQCCARWPWHRSHLTPSAAPPTSLTGRQEQGCRARAADNRPAQAPRRALPPRAQARQHARRAHRQAR
jgi:hypothetical protein